MTSLRRETAVLALLCAGLGVAVVGARAGVATANPTQAATTTDIECPEPTGPLQKDPGVVAAVADLSAWSTDPARNTVYLGQFPCHTNHSVMIYRLPGHPDFDRDAAAVVTAHHVHPILIDSDSAYAPLRAAADHIRDDGPTLAEQGIDVRWTMIARGQQGYVQVGVQGNLNRARAVLAKYGSFVQVTAS